MNTREQIISQLDSFQKRHDMSDRQVSLAVTKDAKWVRRLRSGEGVNLASIESLEAYIAECDGASA